MIKASDGESTYSQRAQRQCAESGGPCRGTADGELGILAGFVMGNLALSSSEIGRKGQETNAISRYNKTARGNVYTQFCSWSFCSCDLSLKWWARLGNSGGLQAVRPRPGPSHPHGAQTEPRGHDFLRVQGPPLADDRGRTPLDPVHVVADLRGLRHSA